MKRLIFLLFLCCTPLHAQTIFSDGFESNNFSAWTKLINNPNICTILNTANPGCNWIVQTSIVHSGTYAARSHYFTAYSTDDNGEMSKELCSPTPTCSTTATNVTFDGWVYLQNNGGNLSTNIDIQRKLIWLNDNVGDSFILTTHSNGGSSLQFEFLDQNCNQSNFQYLAGVSLTFNGWHHIQWTLQENSSFGASNGSWSLTFDGTKATAVQGSGTGLGNLNFQKGCTGSGTPSVNTLWVGQQLESPNGLQLNEYRYWDDILLTGPNSSGGSVNLGPSAQGFLAAVSSTQNATFTLTNNTHATISPSVSITGANASQFGQVNGCGSSLVAGANCTITVTFSPTSIASDIATLNAGGQTASMSGLVPSASFAPTSISFGNVITGNSLTSTTTLTNNGTGTLTVTGSSTSGAPFTQSNSCSNLAPSATCVFSTTYKPTGTGVSSGTLTVTFGNGVTSGSIPLSGTGIAAPTPIPALTNPFWSAIVTNWNCACDSPFLPANCTCTFTLTQ